MEVIGVDVEEEAVKKVNDIVGKAEHALKILKANLKTEDKERCLYSFSEPVQVPASYPPPFSGKPSEDFYKFKEKMLDALLTNQVREKDKVEVLRRNLTGNAKVFVGEYCENINKAFEDLQELYGVPWKIWNYRLKSFFDKVNKPKVWKAYGGREKSLMLHEFRQFLCEAEKFATDHPEMKNCVFSHETIGKFVEIIPMEQMEDILEL